VADLAPPFGDPHQRAAAAPRALRRHRRHLVRVRVRVRVRARG